MEEIFREIARLSRRRETFTKRHMLPLLEQYFFNGGTKETFFHDCEKFGVAYAAFLEKLGKDGYKFFA